MMLRVAGWATALLALVLSSLLPDRFEAWNRGLTPSYKSISTRAMRAAKELSGTSARVDDDLTFTEDETVEMAGLVRDMFYHAWDNYIRYAFPHDELKPVSKGYTDSLGELGNLNLEHLSTAYKGVAMTLIDSLSTLAVLNDADRFRLGVEWVAAELDFDQDVRVNVFEATIRLLGGLVSAHTLAIGAQAQLMPAYQGELLTAAQDLGYRLLVAYTSSPTGIPYAWVNLRHGVRTEETQETNTAACGSLIMEMGMLSRLTGDPVFEDAARKAVLRLWQMRSHRNLLGTDLNMVTCSWISTSGGIGASADSFYEYMLKAYMLLGDHMYYDIFKVAYQAVMQHYKTDQHWYHESDIHSGKPTHRQLTSLQAFWPGLQTLVGDITLAKASFFHFFSVWHKYGLLPERYQWDQMYIHSTERYYPLRPELMESTFHLFTATGDSKFRIIGQYLYHSLEKYSKVEAGYASIHSVTSKKKEDHMHSFFLAETCKYLYLLYNDTFLKAGNYVFTTEGHPLPIQATSARHHTLDDWQDPAWSLYWGSADGGSALDAMVCPDINVSRAGVDSSCHVLDFSPDQSCSSDSECGISFGSCRPRACTRRGRCVDR